MLHSSGAHFHRVFPAIHTVVIPWRIVSRNPKQEPLKTTMSGEDLRQTKRENAAASL